LLWRRLLFLPLNSRVDGSLGVDWTNPTPPLHYPKPMKVSAEYPQERHLIDQREPSIDLNGSHQATDDRSPSHLL
jgi:hypothetical protein